MKVDSNTAFATYGKFLRICVDVDITKPLIRGIMLDDHWQRVEYEGFHIVCYHFGCYGHTTNSYSTKINKLKAKITDVVPNG